MSEYSLITEDRLEVIARCVRATRHLPGVMAECGVYKGGSAALISRTCPEKVVHLFDSLGLPHDDIPGGAHRKGEFAAKEEDIRAYLDTCNVAYHFGVFPATTAGLEDLRYSFVHLDFDLYTSTKAALEYFVPRMVEGGLIVLDDWNWRACPGVARACDELGLRILPGAAQQGLYSREPVYAQGGDTGDCFAALQTLMRLGGGKLFLYPNNVREPFTLAKVETLRRLLEAQPYITGVQFLDGPLGVNLDAWRGHYKNHLNIADNISEAHNLPHYFRDKPWLFCNDPLYVADCIIHRSPRYHGPQVWHRIAEKYKGRMAFIGMPEEWRAWQAEFGEVPYYYTSDWYEVARVISGCQVFCGGQSAPLWTAFGLCKTKIVVEQSRFVPNCHFDRVGPGITCYYPGSDGEIPDLI